MALKINTLPTDMPLLNKQLAQFDVVNAQIVDLQKQVAALKAAGSIAVIAEIPAGLINSSNKIYLLSETPGLPAVALLFLNGVFQVQPGAYSISGNVLTYVTAPPTGQTHFIWYTTKS